jgi:protein TonB
VDSGGYEDAPETPRQPAQPSQSRASVAAIADGLRKPPVPAKVSAEDEAVLQRLKSINAKGNRQAAARATNELPFPVRSNGAAANGSKAQLSAAVAMSEADEVLFESFRASRAEAAAEQKPANKKPMMIGAIAGGALLLVLAVTIPLLRHGKPAVATQPTATRLTTTEVQPTMDDAKPSPSTELASNNAHPAAAEAQPPADAQPAAADDAAPAQPAVQSQMMNDQLNAPTRIARTAQVDTAPPPAAGFGGAALDGLGGSGAAGTVLAGQDRLKVKEATPKIVTVSAGVAIGMLIQKTAPVYPPIAKTARVSGTVVLAASISKTGVIENVRVLSGPVMLRQSAVDAVRTWRYKPYKLNNEPVGIETTVNVIFTLGA